MANDETDAGGPRPAQQLRTYHGFLIGIRYVVLAHIVIGSFLILAFCTSTAWMGALAVALVELAVGLFLARDRETVGWPSEMATLVMTTAAESGQHAAARPDQHAHPAE